MSLKDTHQRLAAVIFGVVFVVVMLLIAIAFPRPTMFQILVSRVVLALAAAGVAATIPGFLNVRLGTSVRAGGAIAVFVVIYFLSPANLVADTDPGPLPSGDPKQTATEYLKVADTLDFEKTWTAWAEAAKRIHPKSGVAEAYENVRVPLGQPTARRLQGVHSASSMPGLPSAHFRIFAYSSVFRDGATREEHVVVMSEDKAWRVAGHTIQTMR